MVLEKYLGQKGPEFFLKLKKENGKVFWIDGYIFVFDEKYVNEICVKQYSNFIKAIGWHRMREGIGDGLLTSEDPKHLYRRRILNPEFHINKINDHINKMSSIISNELKKIQDQKQFNVLDYFLNLSYTVLTNTLFDDKYLSESKEFKSIFDLIIKKSNNVLYPSDEPLDKYKKDLHEITSKIILKRMSSTEKHDDFLNLLIESFNHGDISLEDIVDEVLSMLLAGHETTANVVVWAICHSRLDKDILDSIKNESNIFSNNKENKKILDLLDDLKISEYIIKETLRMYPPVWVTPRESLNDCYIENTFLPKGTKVILSSYVSQRDEKYFDDPDVFMPLRWENNFEGTLPTGAYFPFHIGPRKCIGYKFGEIQAQITILEFFKNFEVEIFNKIPDGLPLSTYRPSENFTLSIKRIN